MYTYIKTKICWYKYACLRKILHFFGENPPFDFSLSGKWLPIFEVHPRWHQREFQAHDEPVF